MLVTEWILPTHMSFEGIQEEVNLSVCLQPVYLTS